MATAQNKSPSSPSSRTSLPSPLFPLMAYLQCTTRTVFYMLFSCLELSRVFSCNLERESTLFQLLSVAVMKHWPKRVWGPNGFIQATGHSLTEGAKAGTWLGSGTETEASGERCLLAYYGSFSLLAYIIQEWFCPQWAGPSHVNHSSRKCPTSTLTG